MTHELCGEINNTKSYHLKIEDNQRNVKAEAALILIVMSNVLLWLVLRKTFIQKMRNVKTSKCKN